MSECAKQGIRELVLGIGEDLRGTQYRFRDGRGTIQVEHGIDWGHERLVYVYERAREADISSQRRQKVQLRIIRRNRWRRCKSNAPSSGMVWDLCPCCRALRLFRPLSGPDYVPRVRPCTKLTHQTLINSISIFGWGKYHFAFLLARFGGSCSFFRRAAST